MIYQVAYIEYTVRTIQSMTINEAAKVAKRHRATIARWIQKGWLEADQNLLTLEYDVSEASLKDLLENGPKERRKAAKSKGAAAQ